MRNIKFQFSNCLQNNTCLSSSLIFSDTEAAISSPSNSI